MSTEPPLVDFDALPRRILQVVMPVGLAAVVGCVVDGVVRGLTFARMGQWLSIFIVVSIVGVAITTALHALRGAGRAADRGERLTSPDVGLAPRRLRAVPGTATAEPADPADDPDDDAATAGTGAAAATDLPARDGTWRRGRLAAARLYLCTPLRPDLDSFLDEVLAAGVDVVQLRDKMASAPVILGAAPAFASAARRHGALFVVNDDPSLAVRAGADGVHVGQDDVSPTAARSIVGDELLVGLSTHSTTEIDAAQPAPIDYFAVGPVSATPTKAGRPGIGLTPLRHAADVGRHPWFVTGGMDADSAPEVMAIGATGVVVVRAITEADDPAAAVRAIVAALSSTDG